ncbi:hypothetical protein ACFXJ8_07685 [Nonomuraea sp. NPDC059194]|uniref:hypothetical protein n=1 Tax=Nonomuraea sp. NPDC059194 TaxID=3346764 RepID=UPI00368A6179
MLRQLVRGAFAGVTATTAMSAVMLAGDKAGLMGDQPPKHVVRGLLPGHPGRAKTGEKPLAVLAHYAFGAGAGALLGLVTRGRGTAWPVGAAYGLAIWLAGYEGWVPTLTAMPPAHRDQPGRPLVMALGHVVFGSVLAHSLRRRAQAEVGKALQDVAEPAITARGRTTAVSAAGGHGRRTR